MGRGGGCCLILANSTSRGGGGGCYPLSADSVRCLPSRPIQSFNQWAEGAELLLQGGGGGGGGGGPCPPCPPPPPGDTLGLACALCILHPPSLSLTQTYLHCLLVHPIPVESIMNKMPASCIPCTRWFECTSACNTVGHLDLQHFCHG